LALKCNTIVSHIKIIKIFIPKFLLRDVKELIIGIVMMYVEMLIHLLGDGKVD
jgi:hypothetical protein